MLRRIPLIVILAVGLAGCAKATPTMPRLTKATAKATAYKPVAASATSSGGSRGASYITSLGAIAPAVAVGKDLMAFRVPGRGLFVASADGTNPRAVAGSTDADQDPAWTEAGDLLVAVRADATGMALVALPAGAPAQRLYSSTGTLKQPTYVPGAGAWLVVEEDGRTGRLMRVERSGKAAALAEGALLGSPTVAPDGRQAVVERRGAAGGTELAQVPLSGGGAIALQVAGKNPRHPAFSPSGRQLAYVADDGVYVGDASGANGRLVQSGKTFEGLAWHPKGTGLVVGAKDAGRTDLVRITL